METLLPILNLRLGQTSKSVPMATLGGSCMPAQQPEELPELFARGVNSGALDALVDLYEPQACLEYPPGQVATGTQAIQEALRSSWQ